MTDVTKTFFSFSKGIRNKRSNPLDFPDDALWAGENVCLDDGALRTRPGYSIVSSGSLPESEVMALTQVRFPTNEVSYLVAQASGTGVVFEEAAASLVPGVNSPGDRAKHYAAYDTENNYIWVFAGTENEYYGGWYNDLWYYDCAAKTWHQVTDATDHPAWSAWGEDMVYDPVNHRLIAYISQSYTNLTAETFEDLVEGDSNFFAFYDIDGKSWSTATFTDDTELGAGYSGRRGESRMIYRDGEIIWMGGAVVGGSVDFPVGHYCALDLETMILTQVECDNGANVPTRIAFGMAYDAVNDKVVIVGGDSYSSAPTGTAGKDAWELDMETLTWTQLPNVPYTDGDKITYNSVVACGGSYLTIGNSWFTGDNPPLQGTVWRYDGGAAWENIPLINDPPVRYMMQAFVLGDDVILTLGVEYTTSVGHGAGADTLIEMCLYPDNSAEGKPVYLYASNDHLPTASASFTQIYAIGEADRVSFAVLNDRVVITEGKAAPPLIWGGCMAVDASDWMYPKKVLVSQDGEHFYDISEYVIDKDVDNAANIGLIRTAGYLAVCTDMPLVEGFYFEMETPNGVESEDAGNQHTVEMAFTSTDHVAWQDLKGTVANWAQDSGATGHFTDASNNAVTLGAGNDCPDVEVGLKVVFAATTATILSITDDGEGSGEVTLSDTITSQAVTEITGLGVNANGLAVHEEFTAALTSWSKTPGTDQFPSSGYSIRQVIAGSELAHSGDMIQLTVRSGSGLYGTWYSQLRGTHHPVAYAIATGHELMISRISIVERDGETANGVTSPTPITFPMRSNYNVNNPAYPSYTVTDSRGTCYVSVIENQDDQDLVSDQIEFAIDETKDYLLIMDVMDVWENSSSGYTRAGQVHRATGAGYYYLTDPYNAPETWNIQDVSEMGFTFQDGYAIGAVEIQVQDRRDLPAQLFVAHTTDDIHLDLSVIEAFQGVTANQTALGSSHVYHAVSLDNRETFQVFLDDEWRTIVRESGGVWQYLDGSDAWQNASSDTLLQALREAFAVTENQMNATELAAITAAQWTGTGGIVVHITPHLDFAVGMVADETEAPVVASYEITYNDTGATAIEGWSGDRWTAGSGWTDNTRLDDIPFGQSGTITYDGATPFEAQYHVLDEVPGFWFRFQSNGTSESTAITRILYKAPCQPLANIGDGQPDTPLAMIFHDVSTDAKKDLTQEVSGARGSFTTDEDGKITYNATDAAIPMATADYLYLGYLLPFDMIEVTPYDDGNAVVSTLSAAYWNGEAWTALDITDDTLDESTSTKTLATKGKISWLLPDDWKMHIPLDADFPRGYYVRFSVSAGLTSTTAIDEVRIYAVPKELAKHKFAVSFRDRIALVSRSDAPDQVDISRALEEYGFVGSDSGSYRVGGMDSIQCAVSAWNGLFLGKNETWHQLQGSTPSDFAWQGVEAARSVPINTRVCVKAPSSGFGGDGDRYGLFFINRFGAFVASGLHVDSSWNSSRSQVLSELTNWWTADAVPRLDLKNLHLACGEYWPVKNWLVWSVPMITETGQTEQTTNNRLIVYDLSIQAWLPPFTISLSALCQGYDYAEGSPGKIGPVGLFGGTYDGRVIRLFEASQDIAADVACSVETGWLHLGYPNQEKNIRYLWLYGSAENDVTMEVFVDGATTAYTTEVISGMTGATGMFVADFRNANINARFVKLRLTWTGATQIYGFQVELAGIREVPGGA